MVYLVITSLVLHLVSFFVMVILYQRIENQKPMDKDKTIREIEDLLVSYTSEMKENNERLVRRMTKISPSSGFKNVDKQPETQNTHQTTPVHSKEKKKKSLPTTGVEDVSFDLDNDYDQYKPPTPSENIKQMSFDSSNTANVLSMSKQGYSENEIAKRLQMGIGEVSLLLKFHNKS
jgi:hypothetical protein